MTPCPLEAQPGLLEVIHTDGGRHKAATRRVGVERQEPEGRGGGAADSDASLIDVERVVDH